MRASFSQTPHAHEEMYGADLSARPRKPFYFFFAGFLAAVFFAAAGLAAFFAGAFFTALAIVSAFP
jgi:hypothetical protein